VAADTRALTLQATFQNPEELLRPGMFATVRLIRPEKRPVTFIPRRAVLNATYGDTVFIVQPPEEEDGFPTVRQQVVRMGETQGDFVEITEGLQGDETVVSAGAFKLKEGDAIKVSDRGVLEPQLNPRPAEG
jgi:membrane fusion protein (multidrug efflux system)